MILGPATKISAMYALGLTKGYCDMHRIDFNSVMDWAMHVIPPLYGFIEGHDEGKEKLDEIVNTPLPHKDQKFLTENEKVKIQYNNLTKEQQKNVNKKYPIARAGKVTIIYSAAFLMGYLGSPIFFKGS